MSGGNGFLKDFMQMRKAMIPANHQGRPGVIDPLPKNPSGQKRTGKQKKQEPTQKQQTEGETTMAKIIEEKPERKEVVRFLQTLANELTTKKME
jgi:hypothetical protein